MTDVLSKEVVQAILNEIATTIVDIRDSTDGSSANISEAITILANEWTEDTTTGYYKYIITNTNITENSIVNINLDLASLVIAENCVLKNVVESSNGEAYIYSETVPSSNMTGTMIIMEVS